MTVRRARPLSAFDRAGVVIVTVLGICAGFFAAMTSDVPFVGTGAVAISYGAIFGLLLYAWLRFANALVDAARRSSQERAGD